MDQVKIGRIYELRIDVNDFYIGSTGNFKERMKTHRACVETRNSKLYKAIRANDGVFEPNVLYEFEYYKDVELLIEERKWYDELKPTLNMKRPYISDEEFKEYMKEYRIKNKDIIDKRVKEYYVKNKDKIVQRKKEYYIKNKVTSDRKIIAYKNRNAILERKRQYDTANKEAKKERLNNNRFICGCGSSIINHKSKIATHCKTQKHQQWEKSQE